MVNPVYYISGSFAIVSGTASVCLSGIFSNQVSAKHRIVGYDVTSIGGTNIMFRL